MAAWITNFTPRCLQMPRQTGFQLVMGRLRPITSVGMNDSLTRTNLNPRFHVSVPSLSSHSYRSFSGTRLPDPPTSRWRWLSSRCWFTDCVKWWRPKSGARATTSRFQTFRDIFDVVLINDHRTTREELCVTRLRTKRSMIHCYRKQQNLNNSSWQTDWRQLNQGLSSLLSTPPSCVIALAEPTKLAVWQPPNVIYQRISFPLNFMSWTCCDCNANYYFMKSTSGTTGQWTKKCNFKNPFFAFITVFGPFVW